MSIPKNIILKQVSLFYFSKSVNGSTVQLTGNVVLNLPEYTVILLLSREVPYVANDFLKWGY